MKLLLGDCLDKLKELDDNSVDSIVTDPPYGLSFMGKKWDYDVPSTEIWEECIRVLKPGGHLLSFAGSRTYHRMAVRIEDAGFEIRDQIMWVYGSGFPKSHNIGKAVDALEKTGKSNPKALREARMGDEYKPTGQLDYKKGRMFGNDIENDNTEQTITNDWEGWGTALKPAHEPIVMARKPLVGTVANNVLEWGTGGINIDGCRIDGIGVETDIKANKAIGKTTLGRFPANIILDEEAGKILDEQSGITKDIEMVRNVEDTGGASRFFYCPKTSKSDRNEGLEVVGAKNGVSQFTSNGGLKCKKCNKWKNSGNPCQCDEPDFEQQQWNGTLDKNSHPTVKPTNLMGYLIRLVTPKGGIVLDPFMGSGSTGKGAVREGMVFIGIERESEYFEIAEARIQNEIDNLGKPKKVSKQKETKVEPIVKNKFWE
jgi:site-specific DNA-methyltransferase (adenine-specific)